jgi:hypothetical protein
MKYRRRQRWLRRIALGLAFATVAVAGEVAPASAKFDDGGGGSGSRYVTTPGWSGPVDPETGIPLSAGIPDPEAAAVEPFVPGVTDFPRAAVAQQPESVADDTTVEWGDGVPFALAAVVLAFALGLWFGNARRPRAAGH